MTDRRRVPLLFLLQHRLQALVGCYSWCPHLSIWIRELSLVTMRESYEKNYTNAKALITFPLLGSTSNPAHNMWWLICISFDHEYLSTHSLKSISITCAWKRYIRDTDIHLAYSSKTACSSQFMISSNKAWVTTLQVCRRKYSCMGGVSLKPLKSENRHIWNPS